MRRVAIIAGFTFVVCMFLAWQDGLAWDVMAGISLGWLAYLTRVLPRVRVAWDGVATGVLCLTLFTVGLHGSLRWLHGEVQKGGGTPAAGLRPCSFRWTVSLVALIVVMFLAGLSTTGIVHQAGWLIASRRSLVEKKKITEFRYGWGSSAHHLEQIGMGSVMLLMAPESPPPVEPGPNGQVIQSWLTEILPGTNFVMGGEFHRDLPWDDPRNSAYFKGVVSIYLNPEVGVVRSPEGYALGHYAGNIRVLGRDRALPGVGPGERANTILAGEVAEGFRPWGDPTNLRDPGLGVNTVSGGFGGPSGSGANFLFVDGSVRFLRDTTDPAVLRKLSRPR